MGKWAHRIAEWDDKTLIYNAHDRKHRFDWRKYSIIRVVAAVVVVGLLGLLDLFLERGVAIAILLALVVIFFVFYVPWRRRRNERLTGSPTKWPTSNELAGMSDDAVAGLLFGLLLFVVLIASAFVFARRRHVPNTRAFGQLPRNEKEKRLDRYWGRRTAGVLIWFAVAGVVAAVRADLPVAALVPICLLAVGFSAASLSAMRIWPFNKDR